MRISDWSSDVCSSDLLENVRYPQSDGSVCGTRPQLGADAVLKLDCGAGPGAATHITGAFAFAAVGKVLELLLRHKPADAKAAPRSARRKPRSSCKSTEQRLAAPASPPGCLRPVRPA